MEYRTFGRTGQQVSALLGFNLSHPQIDVAVVGMRTAEEVDRNADAVESGAHRVDLAALHDEFPTQVRTA